MAALINVDSTFLPLLAHALQHGVVYRVLVGGYHMAAINNSIPRLLLLVACIATLYVGMYMYIYEHTYTVNVSIRSKQVLFLDHVIQKHLLFPVKLLEP